MARGWHGPSGGHGPAREVRQQRGQQRLMSGVAASRNSLALDADGRVLTWGLNDSRGGGDSWFVRGGHGGSIPDSGQLGRPADPVRRQVTWSPAPVHGALADEGAAAIASGRYHALAVGFRSGAVYTWGLNDHGQLGRTGWAGRAARRVCSSGPRCRDGMPRTAAHLSAPRLPPAVAVAAGRYFSAAVLIDGRVFAWGRCWCGRGGRGGDGSCGGSGRERAVEESLTDMSVPYMLTGGGLESERVVQLAAGYSHLMLLTANGSLFTCESGDDGYGGRLQTAARPDAYGQLGRLGSPFTPLRVLPSTLGTLPLRAIAAGRCASFVADARGRVFAWGCGQATGLIAPDRRSPTALEPLHQLGSTRTLAAGEYHALALLEDGHVLTWGVGAGSMLPVAVQGLPSGAVAIAAGYQHALALAPCGGRAEL